MKLPGVIKKLSPIQKLRYRFFKRRVENAQKFISTIDSSLRKMGYNRGSRRRFWKDFIKNIERLDDFKAF